MRLDIHYVDSWFKDALQLNVTVLIYSFKDN